MSFGDAALGWGDSHSYKSLLHSESLMFSYGRQREITILKLLSSLTVLSCT